MKCFVNKDVCIGCGACTAIANNVFEIGDDGLAEAMIAEDKNEFVEVSEEEKENVTDAYESCPVGAIEVQE